MIRSTLDLPCRYITEVTNGVSQFFRRTTLRNWYARHSTKRAPRAVFSFGLYSDAGHLHLLLLFALLKSFVAPKAWSPGG